MPPLWAWTRVGSISNYGSAVSAGNEDIRESDWVLELEDIEGYTSKLLVKERKGNRFLGSAKHRFQKGDLLISKLRMYLKKVLVADEDGYCSSEIMPTSFLPFCQNEFAQLFYVSPYLLAKAEQLQYGCKMPRLGTKDGRNLLFPLPPENEQIRIIQKTSAINSVLMQISVLNDEIQGLSRSLKQKVLFAIFSSDKSYYEKIPICRCFETISTLNKEVKSKDVLEKGLYPVISQGQKDIDGYSNDKTKVIFDVPAILFGDHTRCVKLLRHPFIPGADGTKILRPLIDVEYLYFAMLYSVNTFASRGYGRHFALLKKTLIPQKDLMEQNAIAARLSRLFSLISDIR